MADWSSVFEDEGEELGDWERTDSSSRMGMITMFGKGGYTPFVCYAFTVNYILGVGCLGIPFAFFQSGILLGSILVISLSFISYITVLWVAHATQQELKISLYLMTRNINPFIISPSVSQMKRKHLSRTTKSTVVASASDRAKLLDQRHEGSTSYLSLDKTMISSSNIVSVPSSDIISDPKRSKIERSVSRDNLATDEMGELEVTDLAEEFLGPYGKLVYQSALMALTYVGLLAYTQVFNDTFVSELWPASPRILPPMLFAIVVVPLSCFDLSEQITAQVAMSILRFFSLGILFFGTIVALCVDYEHSAMNFDTLDNNLQVNEVPFVNWSGFGVMFTTAIFSQLFQHSVPGLIRPLSAEDKKHVPTIFRAALITTTVLYIGTGTVCVLYFGDTLRQSVNLNFVNFTWGLTDDASLPLRLLVKALTMTVVLFPALDTLSVFPLIAITLGNNLNAACPGLYLQLQRRDSKLTIIEAKKHSIIVWRLIAAIPPVICSLLVTNLVVSLQIAGLCGIVVALVAPALIHLKTEDRVSLIPMSMQSMNMVFSDNFKHAYVVYVVLSTATIAMLISLVQMLP